MRVPRLVAAVTLLLAITLAITGGCSSGDDDDGDATTTTGAPTDDSAEKDDDSGRADTHDANPDATSTIEVVSVQRVVVTMNELADAFESENPDIGVQISYVDRTTVESAAGDGTAVAVNEASLMSDLTTEGDPVDLGADPMQIVVPPGNPANVQDVTVFGDDPTVTGICIDKIPCGIGAEDVFAAADLDADADETFETGDKLLVKIRKAEIDAGLLRRTQGAGIEDPKWEIVALPDDISASIDYQVALLTSSEEAQTFVTWLTESPTAQEILVSHGLRAAG